MNRLTSFHRKLCGWFRYHKERSMKELPEELSQASHRVSNETMKLVHIQRGLNEEVDAMTELARQAHGEENARNR